MPFTYVNQIVEEDIKAREHLAKVCVHKHGDSVCVAYKQTKMTIASLKYPFATFIFTLSHAHTHTHTH